MDKTLAKYRDARLPRYTSYPTAPHFTPEVTSADYADWLGAIGSDQKLSLYLHIPFCSQMCWYCGCHTKVVNSYTPVANYVTLLRQEIEMVAAALPGRFQVSHIHWGGGTPNLLSDKDFAGLMDLLHRHFDLTPDAEVAVEVDPRRLVKTQAKALAAAGVNRASLGVQDFNQDVQEAINRVQPFEMVEKCVADLRAAGIPSINFDLLYGLPSQNLSKLKRNLRLSAALRPDRIALFGYAHVPWMKKHQQLIDEATLPDGPARVKQAGFSSKMLRWLGYTQIGLDHFALPDDPMAKALSNGNLHRNFQGYTTQGEQDLIGLGPSAISKVGASYSQNVRSPRDYIDTIDQGVLPTDRGIELTGDDLLRRAVISAIMCQNVVDKRSVESSHLIDFDNYFSNELKQLAPLWELGWVVLTEDTLRVTNRGRRNVLRNVANIFDKYAQQARTRITNAKLQ